MLLTANIEGVFGIRFIIDRRECLSHKAEYGATIRFSFVVINVEGYDGWQLHAYNTDLVVFISLLLYNFTFSHYYILNVNINDHDLISYMLCKIMNSHWVDPYLIIIRKF